MGSKNKLKRFIENESFDNVIQPSRDELNKFNFAFRGKWKEKAFNNSNPIVLELGCGKGEYTVNLAKLNPTKNYIGIDIKGARFWRGAKTAIQEKLENVFFLRAQIELLDFIFEKNEIDEIWLTFPDPQIKFQRRKHRLTNTKFLSIYKNILRDTGIVHLKTDSEFLHGYTLGKLEEMSINPIVSNHDIYKNLNAPDEVIKIQTHYEKTYLNEGKKITYLNFKFNE